MRRRLANRISTLRKCQNSQKRSGKAVDRNGYPIFRANKGVKGPLAPRGGFALDTLICSEATVAVAIDGAKRAYGENDRDIQIRHTGQLM